MPTLLLSPDEGQSYGLTRSDYVVNLLGTNCYDNYIFVPHYRFLCPTSPSVISYTINKISNACLQKQCTGVNIDYIRFIETTKTVLEKPMGETCYCERCLNNFKSETGIEILKLMDRASSTSAIIAEQYEKQIEKEFNLTFKEVEQLWIKWRGKQITNLVNSIAEVVKKNGKKITADVYPGPKNFAAWKTKQQWSEWNIDEAIPMHYLEVFQGATVNWIEKECKDANKALNNKDVSYISGLYVPGMNKNQFREGIQVSLYNGAKGICLFQLSNMNDEYWIILNQEIANFKKYQKDNKRFLN